MNFHRSTWNNRNIDRRSCETCRFAEVRTPDASAMNPNPRKTVRCHRHPPLHHPDRPDFHFPEVGPKHRCDEWEADDGAERDLPGGAPACMRCALCAHAREQGRICQKRAPVEITADGHAIEVVTGPNQWCGDHKREEGLEVERFEGILPDFLRKLVDKARRKVA